MAINKLTASYTHPQPLSTLPATQKGHASSPVALSASKLQPSLENLAYKPESEHQIKQAVEKIQEAVNNLAHNLLFSIDKETGKTIIKVMDAQTQEVIRQIPSQEAITIARTLDKVQGLLFSDRA